MRFVYYRDLCISVTNTNHQMHKHYGADENRIPKLRLNIEPSITILIQYYIESSIKTIYESVLLWRRVKDSMLSLKKSLS